MDYKKRIILTSVFAGVLPSAYLISKHSKSTNPANNISNIKGLGFLFSAATYLLVILFADRLTFETGVLESNMFFTYGVSILLFLAIQSLVASIFLFLAQKIYGKSIFSSPSNFSKTNNQFHFIFLFALGLLITASLFVFRPFVFIVFAVYFTPNLYLYSKVKQILRTKAQVIIFTIFFVLLVLMFPFTRFFDAYNETAIVRFMTQRGYYYAPVLLYLVLFYLGYDFLKYILIQSKVILRSKVNTQPFKTIVFSFLFTLTISIELFGIYNFNTPKIAEYNIQIPRKSASINKLKIAMAADFHFSEITSKKFVTKFVDEVNALDADLVLLAGDIFESNKSNAKLNFIKHELSGIKSKYGFYAVEGNHGYYSRTNSTEFFNKTGISLLQDTIITIDNSIQVMGRLDRHNRNRLSLVELLSQAKSDLPIITMDHQPYYEDKDYAPIDIYLSGHTHNGQLFPANLIEKFIYELPWGYKKINNTHFFVTCGAQGWGPQVRTASQSEIMVINVELVN